MKTSLLKIVTVGISAVLLFLQPMKTFAADAGGTFTVVEGASPWFDRVGQWSLTNVPDQFKGSGPLPQGECSSRSLEVPGKPSSIVVGVQSNDAAKFAEKFPAAKDTGSQIAVRNADGSMTLPYMIFTLANPPAKIDGTGVFGAGLLLLKAEGGEAAPAGSPSKKAQ